MENDQIRLAKFVSQFYDDPLGFVLAAYPWGEHPQFSIVKLPEPWKSKYPDCEYGPDAWACQLLEDLGNEVKERKFDGTHAVKPIRIAVSSGHGIGKLHDKRLFVDTPDGVKRWGDLRVGDRLWGVNGKPTTIVGIPYDGVRPAYRVTFDDGSSTVVGREHLWTVQGRQQRRRGKDEWITLETHEILEQGLYRKNGKAVTKKWCIPIHEPVQYPKADLPIDPYVFGVLIGDGSLITTPKITTSGEEIFERISRIYPSSKREDCTDRNAYNIHIYDKKKVIEDLGLGGHRSWEKFIPQIYKESSVDQRLELLRGLIDTDGEVNKAGSVTYSTSSEELAKDILWLVRSLGGKASQQKDKKPFFVNKGERKEGRTSYRLTISMPPDVQLCYVKHKLERIRSDRQKRYLTRWITSIEPVGDIDGMCVAVDRDDGLYLANDFIVTHNSLMSAFIIDWIMSTRPNCKGTITATTSAQLESRTWAQVNSTTHNCMTRDWFDVKAGKGSMKMQSKANPAEWFSVAITCRKENSEAFAGQHAASSTPYYLFDEASGIDNIIFQVAEGGLTDGEPMIFCFGNPTRNSGYFFDIFHKHRSRWKTYKVDSRSCQITNKDTIREWAETYGEDSDFFKVRVKGEFPNQSIQQFIPTDLVEDAMNRDPPSASNRAKVAIIGCDFAMMGDDDTCLCCRIGLDATLPFRRFHLTKASEIATEVVRFYNYVKQDLGMPRVIIMGDAGGIGAPIMEMIEDRGYSCVRVNFGSGTIDKTQYANKRAEIWGKMKLWLQHGGCIPNDERLKEDLTAPEYTVNDKGQYLLERKQDMKARGLHSPDAADCLAVTFAETMNDYELEKDITVQSYADMSYDPFA